MPYRYLIISRFSKLFCCQNQKKICINSTTTDPTTPQVCCYTTLRNVICLKATICVRLNFIKCINRFSKFYLLILLPVPSDVITDVIGIWSVFFESFVYL